MKKCELIREVQKLNYFSQSLFLAFLWGYVENDIPENKMPILVDQYYSLWNEQEQSKEK